MPVTAGLIGGGALASILGGVAGYALSADEREAAARATAEAEAEARRRMGEIDALQIPEVQKIVYQKLANALQYNPEEIQRILEESPELIGDRLPLEQMVAEQGPVLPQNIYQEIARMEAAIPKERLIQEQDLFKEEALQAGPSRLEQISIDPRLQQAQLQALDQLQEIQQGGMTAQEAAQLDQIRRATARDARGKEQAILQSMAEKGLSGSGAELAARLQAAESASERQSQESLDIAAQAQKRALEALTQGAGLAGNIRGQEFGEQEKVATAADVINRFNIENAAQAQMRNIASSRDIARSNIQSERGIEERAIQQAIAQEMRNIQAQRDAEMRNIAASRDIERLRSGMLTEAQQREVDAARAMQSRNVGAQQLGLREDIQAQNTRKIREAEAERNRLQQNVAARNLSGREYIAAQNEINRLNTDIKNRQKDVNAAAQQQRFQNILSKFGLKGQASQGLQSALGVSAQNYQQAGQQQAALFGGIGQGLGQAAITGAAYTAKK